MRRPTEVIIVDSAIIIAALTGRSMPLLLSIGDRRRLMVTTRVIEECLRRVVLGLGRPELAPVVLSIAEAMELVASEDMDLMPAERTLRRAPAAANGSTSDAHLLAAAWFADADVWTHDRDFAGCGIASWSTANLVAALDDEFARTTG